MRYKRMKVEILDPTLSDNTITEYVLLGERQKQDYVDFTWRPINLKAIIKFTIKI